MTLSLSAVFIPIMFMGGLIGMLFHEFGVTIAVAILVSGCVSLTLTPMLCSRFLSPVHTGEARAALQLVGERLQRCAARATSGASSGSCATGPIMLGLLGAHPRHHGRAVHRSIPKGLSAER